MSDITRILKPIERGDAKATSELFSVVYDELRRIAAMKLANERPGQRDIEKLGTMYFELLKDCPRAAFWYQKAIVAASTKALAKAMQ